MLIFAVGKLSPKGVFKFFQQVRQQLFLTGINRKNLVFEVIGGTANNLSLSPNDILYFERRKRRTQIHTIWGIYEVWDKISDIIKRLPEPDFVRCHNSYIVYLPAVREFSMTSIIMKDETVIAVSRNYAAHTKMVFTRWASTEMM